MTTTQKPNKKTSKTPTTLTATECHALLKALEPSYPSSYHLRTYIRNRTMTLLMLDAGLRIGEMLSLRRTDLIIAGEPIDALTVHTLKTKDHAERTIPLSARLKDAIRELHDTVWYDKDSHAERPAINVHSCDIALTPRQVQRIVGAASHKAFGRRINPHVLRHTFATKLMRRCNIRIVQHLLGHKSLSSTQIYTHPDADDLKNAIDQTFNTKPHSI